MKKLLAILMFLNLSMFGCSSDTSPANNVNDNANRANENTDNAPVENISNVNGISNRIAAPESDSSKTNSSNTENRTRSNVNSIKNKKKNDSLLGNADKKADEVINDQNGAARKDAKKLKKNVEKLIKDLP